MKKYFLITAILLTNLFYAQVGEFDGIKLGKRTTAWLNTYASENLGLDDYVEAVDTVRGKVYWDGDSWEVIGSGGSASSVVEELTNPIDAFQGNRISPINDVNGYINDVNIDGATGYLSKNISTGANAYTGFTATTGDIYTQGFSLSHFNSGYFQPYLRNNTLLYGTDDLIFIAGKNDSNIKFRLGNSATSLLTEAGTDEILSLNADKTILAPSLTPALIISGGNSSLITKEYGDANYLGGGGSSSWGSIPGTLSDQTDLNTALNLKANLTNSYGSPSQKFLDVSGNEYSIFGTTLSTLHITTTGGNTWAFRNSGAASNPDDVLRKSDADALYSGFDPSLNQTITGDWIFNGVVALDFVNFTSSPDFGNNTLTGVANGAAPDEAVNKAQLDAVAATIPTSVNTAFRTPAHSTTYSEAYNEAQPNFSLTVPTGVATTLEITGTVNGDIGQVALFTAGTFGSISQIGIQTGNHNYPTTSFVWLIYENINGTLYWSCANPDVSSGVPATTYDTYTGDGTTTIDWSSSIFAKLNFTSQNEIVTFTNPATPQPLLTLEIQQDGVGSRTITWVNSIYAVGGTLPTLSIGANDIDVFHFSFDGTNYKLLEDFIDFQLVAGSDVTAPTAPVLTTGIPTENTVPLSWTASTDNVAVAGYNIYTDGAGAIDVGNVTSYTRTGLTGSTNYDFTVTAYDAAGNESVVSNTENITTAVPTIDYAAAFIAAGTFDAYDQETINNFQDSLNLSPTLISKLDGHFVYPFIGLTEANQNLNFMNPAEFTITPVNGTAGFVRDNEGIMRSGGSGNYLNTNYNQSLDGVLNNVHVAFYSFTSTSNTSRVEYGSNDTTNRLMLTIEEGGAGNTNFDAYGFGAGRVGFNTTDAAGLFIGSRLSATDNKLFEGATELASTATSLNSAPNLVNYILGVNFNGSATNLSSKKVGFLSTGLGLTQAEITVYNSAINYLIQRKIDKP